MSIFDDALYIIKYHVSTSSSWYKVYQLFHLSFTGLTGEYAIIRTFVCMHPVVCVLYYILYVYLHMHMTANVNVCTCALLLTV